ncbi:TPA: DNA translocase FtsK [Citrobacter amalonaticus]
MVSLCPCANLCANVNHGDRDVDSDDYEDPLFDQVVHFVIERQNPSIIFLQRQFRIGFNRASRLIERMEVNGVVSAQDHDGNRSVNFSDFFQWAEFSKENDDLQDVDMSNVIPWSRGR